MRLTTDNWRKNLDALPAVDEPGWLSDLRSRALERFHAQGFPTTRDESWKYTNVAPIAKAAFEPASGDAAAVSREDIERLSFPVFACSVFVFVNGVFAPALSAPRALSGALAPVGLATAWRETPAALEAHLGRCAALEGRSFACMNTAAFRDGAFLRIPAGESAGAPIHLVYIAVGGNAPAASHPRTLIVAEPGSQATVIEDYVSLGAGARFTNPLTEIDLGVNASVDYVKLQREGEETLHVSNLFVRQDRDSRFRSHTLSFGSRILRNDADVCLAAEGAECHLNGLFVASDEQLVDNFTSVDHAKPHGTSRELYKGILSGKSRGNFVGHLIVRPDAQKTDASQSNPNLLMSDGAEVNTKPQLEIYADDVKCAHGSTVGQLDEASLFYLQSRGIPEAAARSVLTRGFASEVTDAVPIEPLRERVNELVQQRLNGRGLEEAA